MGLGGWMLQQKRADLCSYGLFMILSMTLSKVLCYALMCRAQFFQLSPIY